MIVKHKFTLGKDTMWQKKLYKVVTITLQFDEAAIRSINSAHSRII
jgi:hypothetical protein